MNIYRGCLVSVATVFLLIVSLLPVNAYSVENNEMKQLVIGNNQFSVDLYSRLKDKKGSLFFSPYSISTALAMAYAGARDKTREEMAEALHFPVDSSELNREYLNLQEHLRKLQEKGNIELNVANAIWCQKGEKYLEAFLHTLEKYYHSGMHLVDFRTSPEEARQEINSWVEKETKEKIKNLVPRGALAPASRMVLTNAIYFKGKWEKQFNEKLTRPENFFVQTDRVARVPMMYQQSSFRMVEFTTFKAIELPYVGEELSMLIFLPNSKNGLVEFEKELTSDNLDSWTRILTHSRKIQVSVFIPRFTLKSQFSLSSQLQAMGMKSAFLNADFSGINGKRNLSLSDVLHKAFVDVNEEGTEAAAATAVMVALTAAVARPIPVFRADHPFVFVILDNQTGEILFMGRYTGP